MKTRFRSIALLATFFLAVAGCSDVDDARWTEDVRSWDGRIFQLDGYAEKGKSGWPLAHRGMTRFIEYYHRESGAYWKQRYGYHPAVFDIVAGKPVVLLRVNSDGQCFQHGYPPLGLIAFSWTSNGWEPTSVAELPIEKMTFNLLMRIFDNEDPRKDATGFISLVEKRRREGSEIKLAKWIDEYGRRCAKVKEQNLSFDVPPPPTLSGSHGDPQRFKK